MCATPSCGSGAGVSKLPQLRGLSGQGFQGLGSCCSLRLGDQGGVTSWVYEQECIPLWLMVVLCNSHCAEKEPAECCDVRGSVGHGVLTLLLRSRDSCRGVQGLTWCVGCVLHRCSE